MQDSQLLERFQEPLPDDNVIELCYALPSPPSKSFADVVSFVILYSHKYREDIF